jgi:peptidoglycan/xylan/chitin deacetylase (PgdA/CDA1 family)
MPNPFLRFLGQGDFVILLFHGVVDKSEYRVRNYTRKHLEKKYFRRCLTDFLEVAEPLSMDQIIEHTQTRKTFSKKFFAVTFDDGFENNFSVAAPILKDLGIPATFYFSTALLENNGMSWIDRIEYLFELKPQGKINLPWKTESSEFSSKEEQIEILKEIRTHIKSSPNIETDAFVENIFYQLKHPVIQSTQDPLDLKLTWDQVKKLNSDPLFTIGGHSHNHTNMAFLKEADLKWEVEMSLQLMNEKGGIKPRHYAYPEGLKHCYSETVIEELKKNGVICCPTAIEGANHWGEDLFELFRVIVT